MAQTVPDIAKEAIPGCLIDQDSFDRLVEQAWKPVYVTNPGDPTITYAGVGTLDQIIVLDRWPEPHAYEWAWRALVSQDAGTGWGYLQIPNIAGFQRPIITLEGTYRIGATAVQEDGPQGVGGAGASPRGSYMGQEAHHWSSTQRIYMGYSVRDNSHRTYVDFRARYICLP